MRMLATSLLTAGLALAQLDTDTITIVARSASAGVPPGSISVNLAVHAPMETGPDDVLGVVSGLGITERDLTSVDPPTDCVSILLCSGARAWRFQLTAPLASLKDTLGKLARIGGGKSAMSVSYSVYSVDKSIPPDCAYPPLVSQARRYAENVATAAGVRVGRVIALADATGGDFQSATAVYRAGDFAVAVIGIINPWFATPPPALSISCAAVVQFQLLR